MGFAFRAHEEGVMSAIQSFFTNIHKRMYAFESGSLIEPDWVVDSNKGQYCLGTITSEETKRLFMLFVQTHKRARKRKDELKNARDQADINSKIREIMLLKTEVSLLSILLAREVISTIDTDKLANYTSHTEPHALTIGKNWMIIAVPLRNLGCDDAYFSSGLL